MRIEPTLEGDRGLGQSVQRAGRAKRRGAEKSPKQKGEEKDGDSEPRWMKRRSCHIRTGDSEERAAR